MTETQTVVATKSNELARIVEAGNLKPAIATTLIESFSPFWVEASGLVQQAATINVTDPTQVTEIGEARDMRLKLRKIRNNAEKVRKSLKEDSLREGSAIQNVYNAMVMLIEPEEKRLGDMEMIAERMEAGRRDALRMKRWDELTAIGVDPSCYQLGDMKEADYANLVDGLMTAKTNRIKAEQEEKTRRAKEDAERAAENKRIREENERLRLEAEQREAAAKVERDKAIEERQRQFEKDRRVREAAEAKNRKEREAVEAKLREEREAREAAEAKLRREKEAAAKVAAAEAKAKKKAASAPDKVKLVTLADALIAFPLPDMTTDEGQMVVVTFTATLRSMAQALRLQAEEL